MKRSVVQQPVWLTVLTYIVFLAILGVRMSQKGIGDGGMIGSSPLGMLMDCSGLSKGIYIFLSLALITINALLLTHVTSVTKLSPVYAPLPMVTYIAIGFFPLPMADILLSALMNLILIISVYTLSLTFHKQTSTQTVFITSFLMGTAALLYPPLLLFPLVIVLITLRFQYSVKAAAISLFGAVTPAVITSWGWWISGKPFLWTVTSIWEQVSSLSLTVFTDNLYSTYFLSGVLYFTILLTLAVFVINKKSISFTLLIEAKFTQDFLLITLVTAIILTAVGIADCAMFSVIAMLVTPLLYQYYSKGSEFSKVSYSLILITALCSSLLV